jgi:hypothetical protein
MTIVSDVASQLLSCYDLALQDGPNPPPDDNICLRVGTVPFSIGLHENLCCTGFAWVRVLRIYPSSVFPVPDTSADNCPPSSRAVEFELGAVRCLPDHGASSGATCDEWTATFIQVDEDAASMRRALCCMRDELDDSSPGSLMLEGEWVPIDGQGQCIGGQMTVTIQLDCSEC